MNAELCGLFIQKLRKERNMTQSELADLLQVTNRAVSRWETGEGFPDVTLLPKLSDIFNVTIDEILKGTRKNEMNESSKVTLYHLKSAKFLSFSLTITAYLISIGLAYTTYKVWIGLIGYLVIAVPSFIWFNMSYNRYRSVCVFDEEDRKILLHSQKWMIILFLMGFFSYLPQIILVGQNSSWINGVVLFDVYLPYALSIWFIVYSLINVIYFYRYKSLEAFQYYKYMVYLFVFSFVLLNQPDVLVTHFYLTKDVIFFLPVPLFILASIFLVANKQINIYHFILRLSILLLNALPMILFGDSLLTLSILVFMFSSILITTLFITQLVKKKFDALFYLGYHGFLLIFYVIWMNIYNHFQDNQTYLIIPFLAYVLAFILIEELISRYIKKYK